MIGRMHANRKTRGLTEKIVFTVYPANITDGIAHRAESHAADITEFTIAVPVLPQGGTGRFLRDEGSFTR